MECAARNLKRILYHLPRFAEEQHINGFSMLPWLGISLFIGISTDLRHMQERRFTLFSLKHIRQTIEQCECFTVYRATRSLSTCNDKVHVKNKSSSNNRFSLFSIFTKLGLDLGDTAINKIVHSRREKKHLV